MSLDKKTIHITSTYMLKYFCRAIHIVVLTIGSIFFIHTLIASKEFNALVSGPEIWAMPYAESNPYFSEIIDGMRIRATLMALYEQDMLSDIGIILPSAEKELLQRPNPLMFTLVAMAYQKLGDEENMCRTIRNGLRIYANHVSLLDGDNYCE
jgi:hypothetical protein